MVEIPSVWNFGSPISISFIKQSKLHIPFSASNHLPWWTPPCCPACHCSCSCPWSGLKVPRPPLPMSTVTVNVPASPSRTSTVISRATARGKTITIPPSSNTCGHIISTDHTGARWCYVDSAHHSSCQDLHHSARFPNNPWSYEACATPARHQCGYNGYNGYQGVYRSKGYGKW